MALTISLSVGGDIYIGDERFALTRIISEKHARLRRTKDGVIFEITTDEKLEVLPDVLVQLGDRSTTQVARVAIEADRSVLILTADKYELMQRQKKK